MLDTFNLPASAFSQGADGPVLTLLFRQAGSSLSGQKQPANDMKNTTTETDYQKRPIDSQVKGVDPSSQISQA